MTWNPTAGTVMLELHNSWNKKKNRLTGKMSRVAACACAYSLSPPSHFSSGAQGRAGLAQAERGSAWWNPPQPKLTSTSELELPEEID